MGKMVGGIMPPRSTELSDLPNSSPRCKSLATSNRSESNIECEVRSATWRDRSEFRRTIGCLCQILRTTLINVRKPAKRSALIDLTGV